MLGVGSLSPARYCCEPDMARLEVLLPVSARLLATAPPFPMTSCPKSVPPGDRIGSSACFCLLSRSWADTVAERGISEVGALGGPEDTDGCGIGLREAALCTCTEDGTESEGEDKFLSRHKTYNQIRTVSSFLFTTICSSCSLSSYPQSYLHLEGAACSWALEGKALVQGHVLCLQQSSQRHH